MVQRKLHWALWKLNQLIFVCPIPWCSAQASLGKLNELRATNTELNRQVGDTKKDNSELVWAKERLNREMEKLREELGDVQTHLNSAESEREVALEEVKSLQHLLFQNKEADVCVYVCVCCIQLLFQNKEGGVCMCVQYVFVCVLCVLPYVCND